MDILIELIKNANDDSLLYVFSSCIPIDHYISLLDHTFGYKWRFIGVNTYRKGEYHSYDDKPSHISINRAKSWQKNGKLHRKSKPSVIYADGSMEWFDNGQLYMFLYNDPVIY